MRVKLSYFFLLCTIACSPAKTESDRKIFLDLDESGSGKISELVKSFDYLLVDYSDDLPIVQPYRIEFYKDLIFIEDNELNNLFIIDDKGKVKNIIKSQGEGPGQFTFIDDFQVEENQVLIKDNLLSKFIAFDFDGNFLYEEKASNKSFNFYAQDNFTLHYFSNNLDEGENNFVKENALGEVENEYYPVKEGYAYQRVMSLEKDFVFDSFRGELSLTIPFSYDIAFFDLNGNLKNILSFSFGKYGLTDQDRLYYNNGSFLGSNDEENTTYVEEVNQFFPTKSNYLLFLTNGTKETHLILMDEKFTPINQYKKLENDIDGLPIKNSPRWQRSNQLIQRTSSSYFLNNYLKNEEQLRSDFPEAQIHEFVEQNRYKLERDWLVLIFWNLKD